MGCKDKTSSWHLNGFPVVVTLGQQCNVGEKPTVMLYTYLIINLHAGTPKNTFNKQNQCCCCCSSTSPVLSTCPLHTNSGCVKERRILIGQW